ncbi:MFS transporter [Nonomuraea sp. NPDC050786]|uniref:MFS transporter n=1 Tax=Nonomuraea sp. NPDC050786 TaxID=3154840 RepID=UPI0033E5EB71
MGKADTVTSIGVPPPHPARDAVPSSVRGWLAILAVTLGIFVLMTSELLPVGLLTPIGAALEVSEGTTALMVIVPGLVAAVAAPIVTVATARIDRRLVLVLLIGMVGAANFASASATSFAVVLLARFLIGISVGGFWSLAGGIALRLVRKHQVARATAVVFGGVETASVLGVPAGQWKVADVSRQNPSLLAGAGDMISTTKDVHTFFSALNGGKLLPAKLLAEMREPHPKSDPLNGHYGLGLFGKDLGPACGTVLNHNGSPPAGYAALMYSSPDGRKTLTASLTAGYAAFDLAAYPKLLDGLVKAAFCGGQTTSSS